MGRMSSVFGFGGGAWALVEACKTQLEVCWLFLSFFFFFFPFALEDPFAFCPFSFLLGHTPRILAPRGGVISPQEVIPNRGFFFFPLSVPCLSPFFFLFLDLGDCLY